jgi:hypothetical protein
VRARPRRFAHVRACLVLEVRPVGEGGDQCCCSPFLSRTQLNDQPAPTSRARRHRR